MSHLARLHPLVRLPLERVSRQLFRRRRRGPAVPQQVGMAAFQRAGWWDFDPQQCPCDVHFVDYLRERGIGGKSIFHFGTGAHHYLGLQNRTFLQPNEVLGVTAAAPEHSQYVELAIAHPGLAKFYKVWFADVYTLTERLLPSFDLVTLFHLCEFYMPQNAALLHHDDESLFRLFVSRLRPDGRIALYRGSSAWNATCRIAERLERTGAIRRLEDYRSLRFYTAAARASDTSFRRFVTKAGGAA